MLWFVLSVPKTVSNIKRKRCNADRSPPLLLVGKRWDHTKQIWLLIRIKHDKSIWWMPWH